MNSFRTGLAILGLFLLPSLALISDSKCPMRNGGCDCTCIDKLPYSIKKSGKYCIGKDLVVQAGGSFGIDLQVDTVDIDLCGHSLIACAGQPVDIIRINDHRNISIHDGTIKGAIPVDNTQATDFRGIGLSNVSAISVERVSFEDLRQGVLGKSNSLNSMISVTNCTFRNLFSREPINDNEFLTLLWGGGAISLFKIQGLLVDSCHFYWDESGGPFATFGYGGVSASGFGTTGDFVGEADNGIIKNCTFTNHGLAISWWPDGNTHGSLLVEDCEFLASSNTAIASPFLSGINLSSTTCRTAHVRGCNFQRKSALPNPCFGIRIAGAQSVIVEDCNFALPNTSTSGISLLLGGSSATFVDNAIVRGCAFSGAGVGAAAQTRRHVVCARVRGALIENSQFTDACTSAVSVQNFVNFMPTMTVVNNVFDNNPGIGCSVQANVQGTILKGNFFCRNGTAINLDATSSLSIATENVLHLNGAQIVENGSLNNTLTGNLETTTEAQAGCVFSALPAAKPVKPSLPDRTARFADQIKKLFGDDVDLASESPCQAAAR